MREDLKSGDLKKLLFPKILWGIYEEKASGILSLRRRQIEKKVFFTDGEPVFSESNLLHETLGKFLVEQGIIDDTQSQEALLMSIETKKRVGEVLVELGYISATQLYQMLRKNIAFRILDCFLWSSGQYEWNDDRSFQSDMVPFRMNPGRIILQGLDSPQILAQILDEDLIHEGQAYALISKPKVKPTSVGFSASEIRLLKYLRKPITPEELSKDMGIDLDRAFTRLYALSVFGFIEPVEKAAPAVTSPATETATKDVLPAKPIEKEPDEVPLKESAFPESAQIESTPPPAPAVEEKPTLDPNILSAEDQAIADIISHDYDRLMEQNYLELLGVERETPRTKVGDAFLEFSKKFGPHRFEKPLLKDVELKARDIFLRGVKAFSVLDDVHQKEKYIDKLKAESDEQDRKKDAGAAFKIKTKLLDGNSQYQKGLGYLKEKNYDAAVEHFEYAKDIDGRKSEYLAYLGWAKFLQNRTANKREALTLLKLAQGVKPTTGEAQFLMGKYLLEQGETAEALPFLKKAAELKPKDIEIVREARNAERTLKTK